MGFFLNLQSPLIAFGLFCLSVSCGGDIWFCLSSNLFYFNCLVYLYRILHNISLVSLGSVVMLSFSLLI